MHFGQADLGHVKRTERLATLAAQVAADPSGSIPEQTVTWADTKAAYRLFDRPEVTFEAVAQAHWDLRHQCGPGRFAILSDTTELDFGHHRRLSGVGPTGNGSGQGFRLHSALLADADRQHLLCVAGAELGRRQPKRPGESSAQRRRRERESERWGRLVERIGSPPAGAQWIHVMDREADNFEVFAQCQEQRTDWVVRASQLKRKVGEPECPEAAVPLHELQSQWALLGEYSLDVPAAAATGQKGRKKARAERVATMEVRVGHILMPLPWQPSASLKRRGATPIAMAVVWTRELNPPAGEEAIEWLLYTSLHISTLAEAMAVVKLYQLRWLIEEWHKALKTGTRILQRQLRDGERLAPLVALSSISALRLVQLKTLARAEPERPANEVVPLRYQAVLRRALRQEPQRPMTVREFFRSLARLGGFLARRSDGEPGWQTTWRGWEKLVLLVRGSELDDEAPPPPKRG